VLRFFINCIIFVIVALTDYQPFCIELFASIKKISPSLLECPFTKNDSNNSADTMDMDMDNITIGARVILTRNLCVEKGLVNGAIGTVRTKDLPNALVVQFDKCKVPIAIKLCFLFACSTQSRFRKPRD
jgi:hypothetical protein